MFYLRFLGGAGGILLALMLLANAFLPEPATTPSVADFDHPRIRITATTKGPEKVVIDTSLPTTAAPVAVAAASDTAAPPSDRVRQALAAIPAEPAASNDPAAAAPAQNTAKEAKSPAHKPHRRLAASRSPAYGEPPRYHEQQQPFFRRQPQFAGNFFGFWLR